MCGVVGISSTNSDAAQLGYFGLFALQHRGQEAAGLAVADNGIVRAHKDRGLVAQALGAGGLDRLSGGLAIGHTRYSTTGPDTERNVQPYLIETMHGPLGVAHNGNVVNAGELRAELLERGVGLQSSSDTEVMTLMLAAATGDSWEARLASVMDRWVGAFSLVILSGTKVIACRDRWGFRPLSLGRLPNGGHAVASETGALRTIGCTDIREIEPGEIVVLSRGVARTYTVAEPAVPSARCSFEHVYFSRPDADWDGRSIHQVRQELGRNLAKESSVPADVVIPVPDSSTPAAIGYADQEGIAYSEGFVKNRYIGRTFIEPTDELRRQGVALKFMTLGNNLEGKRVVVVDDSIVRGTTLGPLVKLVRAAGAAEVHVRITCPPIAHPCYFGVDMGTYDELIAHHLTVEEISEHIGADSLHYLSLQGMQSAIGRPSGYCDACFSGRYPVPVQLRLQTEKARFEGVLE